ncbi:glycosyltransferase family 4 protein [Halobacteria archaeon HArc-gm2]|nr:glycosyltransferase family 4 protein [Halobacteria archaeon HArc-gm2]
MKVAYVTPYYNGGCDGRFGRFHDWIHAARDGESPFEFDVYAFTACNGDETIASPPHSYLGDGAELWGSKWNKPEFVLNAPRIRGALQAGDYDLIHVLVMDTIVLPTILSLPPDVPLVVGPDIAGWSPIREGMFTRETTAERVKNRIKFGLKNLMGKTVPYDRAVAFSEHHRDIMSTFSISAERTSILRGGVADCFTPDNEISVADPPEILWVGDFNKHKGYSLFLEALAATEEPVTARLVGAGDPNEDFIEALDLEDAVTVEGFVPRSRLPELYREADLHVVPSIDETAGPNTQLEALACGTPVVVTDKKGINEYAPDDAVVSFWPRNVDSLQAALETGLAELEELTTAALRSASKFQAIHTVVDLERIYGEILAENK